MSFKAALMMVLLKELIDLKSTAYISEHLSVSSMTVKYWIKSNQVPEKMHTSCMALLKREGFLE